jgi:hypothetical protein
VLGVIFCDLMESDGGLLPPEKTAAVKRELARVMASPPFSGTKRAQDCLQFLVTCALEQKSAQLKERVIGTEVFGREPDYDTGADAIVRVCVNEIRKKLAQYYVASPDSDVVIDLPLGSYVPKFHWKTAAPAVAAPDRPRRKRRAWLTLALAVCGIAAVLLVSSMHVVARKSALDRFWGPVLESRLPAVLCIGNSVVFVLSDRLQQPFLAAHPGIQDRGPYVVPLAGQVPAEDLIPLASSYVAAADAVAAAQVASALTRMGKPFQVRTGSDINYTNLRANPAVLIGFANPLHRELTRHLRFTPKHLDHQHRLVQDHVSPERSFEVNNISPDGIAEVDYGIISRLVNAETGQPLIQAGGVASFGTRAACEFVADPRSLEIAAAQLPPDWEHKSVQIVIRVRALGNTTSPSQVVAVHSW